MGMTCSVCFADLLLHTTISVDNPHPPIKVKWLFTCGMPGVLFQCAVLGMDYLSVLHACELVNQVDIVLQAVKLCMYILKLAGWTRKLTVFLQ